MSNVIVCKRTGQGLAFKLGGGQCVCPSAEECREAKSMSAGAEAMSHACHAKGCSKPVPPKMFACSRHWYMLPKAMRDAIWKHYRPGQEISKTPSQRYLVVANEAIEWLANHEAEERSRQGALPL